MERSMWPNMAALTGCSISSRFPATAQACEEHRQRCVAAEAVSELRTFDRIDSRSATRGQDISGLKKIYESELGTATADGSFAREGWQNLRHSFALQYSTMPTLLSTRRVVTTTKFDHDFPGATTEWRVISRAGHTAKASTRTRAPSCSDPCRSIRRGSSAGMDWRSYCCPAAAVRPSAYR